MPLPTFFNALFAGKAEKDFILVWEKHIVGPGKASHWARDVEQAVQITESLINADTNVYFGCGTSPRDMGEHARCSQEDIAGIPGLWLDVDLMDEEAHAKDKKYTETYERVAELIGAFAIKPSGVVFSGHGFHFWWLFDQFWNFADDNARGEAASLTLEFIQTFRQYFKLKGYDLDPVHDLSRILRAPGTINKKTKDYVPTCLYENNLESRFSLLAIKNALLDFQESFPYSKKVLPVDRGTTIPKYTLGTYKILADAEPPGAKFETLMDSDEKFAATWKMMRKDMKDQTPSAYDYSLANFGMMYGWEWQEIIDMMIAFRRENKLQPKLREDYYFRTLNNVQKTMYRADAQDNIEMLIDESIEMDLPQQRRREVLRNNLTTLLGVRVDRIIKYPGDPSEYKLVSDGKVITLGGIAGLVDQRIFRHKIMDVTGKNMTPISKERWVQVIVPALLAACEEEDTGPDTTSRGVVANWLYNYLTDTNPQYDPDEAMQTNKPFFFEKHLYLSSPALRYYLVTMRREGGTTAKSMGIMLKEYGFSPHHLNFKDENGRYNGRSLWRVKMDDPAVEPFLDRMLLDEAERIRAEKPPARPHRRGAFAEDDVFTT